MRECKATMIHSVNSDQPMKMLRKHSQLLHELSFSIYCALLVVLEETWKTSSRFLYALGYPLTCCIYPVLGKLFHRNYFWFGTESHSILLWMLFSLPCFVIVCLAYRVKQIRRLLSLLAGIVIVSGMPFLWLSMGRWLGLTGGNARWLMFETCLVVIFAAFYVLQRQQRNLALTNAIIMVLHFAIWGSISSAWLSIGYCWLYLSLGVCTALLWILAVPLIEHGQSSLD